METKLPQVGGRQPKNKQEQQEKRGRHGQPREPRHDCNGNLQKDITTLRVQVSATQQRWQSIHPTHQEGKASAKTSTKTTTAAKHPPKQMAAKYPPTNRAAKHPPRRRPMQLRRCRRAKAGAGAETLRREHTTTTRRASKTTPLGRKRRHRRHRRPTIKVKAFARKARR